MSFADRAKKIIAKNQDLFLTLEELDRTGKLKKRVYKKKVNFTVDEEIFNRFRRFCRDNGLNMSAKIEQAMNNSLETIKRGS